jgi:alcohol/geraniol dehydrogenase (NADP+)
MSEKVKGYAAFEPKGKLQPFEYELGELRPEEVEIKVHACGLCHSDVSMLNNDWGMTTYPIVCGHEATGEVIVVGEAVKNLKVGDKVGVGWTSASCQSCEQCLRGDNNLCPNQEATIVNRPGGFAERVRAHWAWAIKIPDALDISKVGPLFCGGSTVFNPIVEFGVKPADKVGVVGIGGLGHMALMFLNKWGCEVTAFTSSDSKADEAKAIGAHYVVNSRSDAELAAVAGKFDFILSTVNVPLNWQGFINALAPKGRLNLVGAVLEPIPVSVFPLLVGQKTISASPSGAPKRVAEMLEFCARHNLMPVTEHFKMSEINEAFEHLEAGKARYRIVLENDFS